MLSQKIDPVYEPLKLPEKKGWVGSHEIFLESSRPESWDTFCQMSAHGDDPLILGVKK